MSSLITPVALDVLPSWPTRRLLGLRDKLLRCESSLEASDVQNAGEVDPAVIRFKDDPRWGELDEAALRLLSTREHVPGGDERRLMRHRRARERPERRNGRGR